MRAHLEDDRELQNGIENRQAPIGQKVVGLGSMELDEIERQRSRDIHEDERGEDREFPEAMPHQEHREKRDMRPKADRPEQEIETGQMHPNPSVGTAVGAVMHWILRQMENGQDQADDVGIDWLRIGSGYAVRGGG